MYFSEEKPKNKGKNKESDKKGLPPMDKGGSSDTVQGENLQEQLKVCSYCGESFSKSKISRHEKSCKEQKEREELMILVKKSNNLYGELKRDLIELKTKINLLEIDKDSVMIPLEVVKVVLSHWMRARKRSAYNESTTEGAMWMKCFKILNLHAPVQLKEIQESLNKKSEKKNEKNRDK